jgi:hypothetical protein
VGKMNKDQNIDRMVEILSKYSDEQIDCFYKYSIGFAPVEVAILNHKKTSIIRADMKQYAEEAHVAMRALRTALKRVFKRLNFHSIPKTQWRAKINEVLEEIVNENEKEA